MGFLSFLNKEASTDWPTHQKTIAILDFPGGSLNGIKLGSPGASIRTLGKPSNKNPIQTGDYYYLVSGMEYEDIDSEVLVFRCIFHDRWNKGYSPCNLILKSGPKSLEVNTDTTIETIKGFIGEPIEIEEKDEISIYYYDFENHYYEFDFFKNGKIVCIHAYMKEPK